MNLSTKSVTAAINMFAGESGLKISVEALQDLRGELGSEANFQIDSERWQTKMAERIPLNRNPKVSIALVKVNRGQKEKLSEFGAIATLEVELSSTHERVDNLQQLIGDYVDASCDVLNRNQGLWSKGVYYAGGFNVEISPVSRGGLNFVQNATISFELNLWQK